MGKYNKLVRDLIPEIIRESGGKPIIKSIIDHDEHVAYLNAKLSEELAEYQESLNLEELADIQEIYGKLSEVEKTQIISICDEQIKEYYQRRVD